MNPKITKKMWQYPKIVFLTFTDTFDSHLAITVIAFCRNSRNLDFFGEISEHLTISYAISLEIDFQNWYRYQFYIMFFEKF